MFITLILIVLLILYKNTTYNSCAKTPMLYKSTKLMCPINNEDRNARFSAGKKLSVWGNGWEVCWMLNRFVKKSDDGDKKFSRGAINCGTVTNEKGQKWRARAVPPKMSYDRLAKFSFRPSLPFRFLRRHARNTRPAKFIWRALWMRTFSGRHVLRYGNAGPTLIASL